MSTHRATDTTDTGVDAVPAVDVPQPGDAIGPPAAVTRPSVGTRAFLLLSLAAGAVATGPMAEWTTVSFGGHGIV